MTCRAADLTEAEIAHRVQQHGCGAPPVLDGHLRPAAVLVPLLWAEDTWQLLFTRRTETVHSHKGQVSFPGGGADPDDGTPIATALREAQEEIGLPPVDVRVLGCLEPMPTISHFLITPVVGRIPWPFPVVLSPDEVGRVFTIPLDWLADASHWEIRPRTIPPGIQEEIIYYQLFTEELLWGITARITHNLIAALRLCSG